MPLTTGETMTFLRLETLEPSLDQVIGGLNLRAGCRHGIDDDFQIEQDLAVAPCGVTAFNKGSFS